VPPFPCQRRAVSPKAVVLLDGSQPDQITHYLGVCPECPHLLRALTFHSAFGKLVLVFEVTIVPSHCSAAR
jgi:hypothetical protein